MREKLQTILQELHLQGMSDALDKELEQAEKADTHRAQLHRRNGAWPLGTCFVAALRVYLGLVWLSGFCHGVDCVHPCHRESKRLR